MEPLVEQAKLQEVMSRLREMAMAGEVNTEVTVKLTDVAQDTEFKGTVVGVYAQLRALQIQQTRENIAVLRFKLDEIVKRVKGGGKVYRNELDPLMEDVRQIRKEIEEEGSADVLREEGKNLDSFVAQLMSVLTVAGVQEGGIGKTNVLGEKRLAREEDGTRDFPLKDIVEQMKDLGPLSKIVEQLMDQNYPELMKLFYPRVYENVGKYHSPRQCAAALANVVAECLRYGFHKAPTAYRLMMPSLKPLIDHKVPMFFIAPELLQAVQRTDFADDIDWTEMKLPFEEGVFVLPKQGLVHPEDGEVSMLYWSRKTNGDYPPPVSGIPTITVNPSMAVLALCPEKMIWYDSTLSAAHRKTFQLRNLFYRQAGEEIPAMPKYNPYIDADLTEQDAGFLEKMGVIAFGTLMAMNARPELWEKARLLKRVCKEGKTKEFWSPNVIGLKYKLKREVARVVGGRFVVPEREHGTHASPRMHWRRGHFRNQPVGKGRKERKVIWLEPVLVGA
jgi:hypothetical protein